MPVNPEIVPLITEIRDDRTRGASELARRAAGIIAETARKSQTANPAELLVELKETGAALMTVRPAMAPVYNIIEGLLKSIEDQAAAEMQTLRGRVIAAVDSAVERSLKSVERIAFFTAEMLEEEDTILTHSYSSTVVAALKAAAGKDLRVIVTRSGAGRTGELAAKKLAGNERVTFIDDTAAGIFIAVANKVLVGADRICADGSLVNGAGTYLIALAARRASIPFYVLCELLKLDRRLTGEEVDLEEKDPAEVAPGWEPPPEVSIRNPYFDVTPHELITGIITEEGLLTPAEVVSRLKGNAGDDAG